MRASTFVAGLAAFASFVSAAPLSKRNNDGGSGGDGGSGSMNIDPTVLQFALTLEHLEAAFYKGGLEKYSAEAFNDASFPEWVRFRLSEIGAHEATHVSFLEGALTAAGVTPTAPCTYSFPDDSPESFIAVAQILEGVGVSAYAGAAALITEPAYLTAAAQILSVEARHSAWILGAAQSKDSFPAPFDIALGLNEVYSLAALFITSCPESNPALPVKAFPVASASPVAEDGTVTFTSEKLSDAKFALFITPLGQEVVALPESGTITVPEGLYGQNYVVLTSQNATLSDDIVVAGPAVVYVPLQATLF